MTQESLDLLNKEIIKLNKRWRLYSTWPLIQRILVPRIKKRIIKVTLSRNTLFHEMREEMKKTNPEKMILNSNYDTDRRVDPST